MKEIRKIPHILWANFSGSPFFHCIQECFELKKGIFLLLVQLEYHWQDQTVIYHLVLKSLQNLLKTNRPACQQCMYACSVVPEKQRPPLGAEDICNVQQRLKINLTKKR